MTKPTAKSADAADTKILIVLGYDEEQKPRAARFPAADANLVAKAAQLMDLKVYEATTKNWLTLPRNCRLVASTPTAKALCRTSGKTCTARSSWSSRPSPGRHRQRQRRPAGGVWPAKDLGRDRAWPPRHRARSSGIRLVGSHCHHAQRRHAHAAVSGLSEAAQVLAPSCGSRVDQSGTMSLTGSCR